MNRRFGTVAIVLMALTALAGVLSFAFFSKKDLKNSGSSHTSSNSAFPSPSPSPSPSSSSSSPSTPRPDQPPGLQPTAQGNQPDWKLLDWTIRPLPEKPGTQLRAAFYSAPGPFRFVRVEEQIEKDNSGNLKVLIRKEMVGDQIIVKLPSGSSQQKAEELARKIGATADTKPFAPDTWLLNFPPRLEAVPEGMQSAKSNGPLVEYTEPNIIVHSLKAPNDPKFNDFTLWQIGRAHV